MEEPPNIVFVVTPKNINPYEANANKIPEDVIRIIDEDKQFSKKE